MNLSFKKTLFSLATILSLGILVGCGPTEPNNEKIDYASTNEAKLVLDYKNKTFLNDGIGQVKLSTSIDGDTAHFIDPETNDLYKCRFAGVDTPESTGKIQPYGKAASNFTKETLKKADKDGTIVISVPGDEYTKPSFDSTGTRYLATIWVNETTKNCDYKELKCLNIMLVQEGYSEVKNAADLPRLEPVFRSAWEQAKELKLNMFSGEEDPLFNYGEYDDTSLLDIKIEVEKTIEAHRKGETYENKFNGAKVRVVGTVVGYANNILYLQNFYSQENGARVPEGEYAGINVFTGMAPIPSKFYLKNTYLQLCGTCIDDENFGFQITGVSFKAYGKDENDAKVLIKAEDNTDEFKLKEFNINTNEVDENDFTYLNSPINFKDEVIVTGGYDNLNNNEVILFLNDKNNQSLNFNAFVSFLYKPDPSNPSLIWKKIDDFKGKTFKLKGVLSIRKAKSGEYRYQILPTSSEDLVEVKV